MIKKVLVVAVILLFSGMSLSLISAFGAGIVEKSPVLTSDDTAYIDNLAEPMIVSISPFFQTGQHDHDVGVASITSPVSGPAAVFTPEVTVENFGSSIENGVPVNLQIDKIIYDAWTECVYDGIYYDVGHWEQMDYASGGDYGPYFMPEPSDYFALANAYTHPYDVFDVGLFTPSLDLSGFTSVTLEFYKSYCCGCDDWAEVNTYSGGFYEETIATYNFVCYCSHEELVFDPSEYTDPSNVTIEFYYNSVYITCEMGWFSIDDIRIDEIGFSEGFEGSVFPPINTTFVPEYNEIVTTNIGVGESKSVIFPDWTPTVSSGITDYRMTACTQLATDGNTNNDGMTEIITLDYVGDFIPPEITDVTLTTSPIDTDLPYGWANVTCTVTDDESIDKVNLVLTYPDTTTIKYPMTNIPVTDTYYHNTTLTDHGNYAYHIWANDTNGNENISDIYHFEIIPEFIVVTNNLSYRWNMVSIPFNHSVNKADLYVEHGGTNYAWADAVSGGIVANAFFGWDRINQVYEQPSGGILEPGCGYWMWAYYSCILKVDGELIR